jgi:hypothetical protein
MNFRSLLGAPVVREKQVVLSVRLGREIASSLRSSQRPPLTGSLPAHGSAQSAARG